MTTLLLIVSLLANAILAAMLYAAHADLKATDLQGWVVRRTFLHLREGEPLVGDERHIASTYLGDRIVDAIQSGAGRKEARHD